MSEETGGLTVGVDLGGTKIAAGTVDPGGEIVSRVRVPTPHDPDRIAEAIAEAVQRVREGWDDVRAVGVGAAGYVDNAALVAGAQRAALHQVDVDPEPALTELARLQKAARSRSATRSAASGARLAGSAAHQLARKGRGGRVTRILELLPA
ncbi:ROK family protein [Streptomyces sp. PSKA54]|uniref:ROK family protein n=1 Tax=Streptomyces himalayensis subsp. aureolus TaxID=2758039 RepID=A0A7W2CXM8_9ACTN|nr:ROK family protein [Streptomyces himalayensis]MBA4860993.1 ROK family protein [Streptomyces himalayensis subsp. aureolus]